MLRLPGNRWIALEFKLQDLWLGIYWERKKADYYTTQGVVVEELHVWLCLIPCFPIHFVTATRYDDQRSIFL